MKKGVLETATLRISGATASSGTVRVGTGNKQVTGTLGGKRFDVNIAKVRLSRAGAGQSRMALAARRSPSRCPGLARLR